MKDKMEGDKLEEDNQTKEELKDSKEDNNMEKMTIGHSDNSKLIIMDLIEDAHLSEDALPTDGTHLVEETHSCIKCDNIATNLATMKVEVIGFEKKMVHFSRSTSKVMHGFDTTLFQLQKKILKKEVEDEGNYKDLFKFFIKDWGGLFAHIHLSTIFWCFDCLSFIYSKDFNNASFITLNCF